MVRKISPLRKGDEVFRLYRKPDNKPGTKCYTIVEVTEDPNGWFVIGALFPVPEGQDGPETCTITPELYQTVYYDDIPTLFKKEIIKYREEIEGYYQDINSLKHYLWEIEILERFHLNLFKEESNV